MNTSDFNL